jgi:DNA-binding MarR family transcriptional regulator
MSTKKSSPRKNRNTRSLRDGSPEGTSEPQGLKPASLLSSDGKAESRALPKPGHDLHKAIGPLPEPIREFPKPIPDHPGAVRELRNPIDETSPNPPEDRSGKPRARSPKPETLTVADRLHSAAIHLLRRVRKQDIATGEGPARLSALSVLVFGGPKTLGELAAAEQVKPPTMSRIVAGLAKSRLVDIAVDPGDARRMQIRATAKGKSILQQGRERRIAYLASQLDRLTQEELRALGDAVEILNSILREWD